METLYIGLLTIIAASVGTLTGFGTSTIMVPILSFFIPLPQTLLLVGIIHYFGDIWKIFFFKEGVHWNLILFFGIPGVIFTFIGARIVLSVPENLLAKTLGGFLIAYSSFLFLKPEFKLQHSTKSATVGGALYGFFAGVFGVGGAIRGAFLSAFNLPKAVYIATAGVIAIAVDSTRLITYFSSGVRLNKVFLLGFLLFIPASFLGAFIAKKISLKISQKQFRSVMAVFLFLVGVRLFLFN